MQRVILFDDILYTGRYRCYDIDDVNTYDEVFLYNNPNSPIEICSVLNIQTKYMITLVYSQKTSEQSEKFMYVNIEDSNPDIRLQTNSSSYIRLRTSFIQIILRKRFTYPDSFNEMKPTDGFFPLHKQATEHFDYTENDNVTDEIIKSFVCINFNVHMLYSNTLDNINNDITKLNESLSKCQAYKLLLPDKIAKSYKDKVDNLNNEVNDLVRENTRIHETLSYGEMLFQVVFGVGIVLCLFVTLKYISKKSIKFT